MKHAGIITNASKDPRDETVIAEFVAMAGTCTYRIGNMSFIFDFDKDTIEAVGLNAGQYTWEPTDEDLAIHELDLAIYLQGSI